MSFFGDLMDKVKAKNAELKERKEFLDMVEKKAKPLRRMAYMEQMLKEVVGEGVAKAKEDAQKRKPKVAKKEEDFGMELSKGLADPYKFLEPKSKSEEKK